MGYTRWCSHEDPAEQGALSCDSTGVWSTHRSLVAGLQHRLSWIAFRATRGPLTRAGRPNWTSFLASCRGMASDDCAGVTISGGEPFEQPVALAALIDGMREWGDSLATEFDVLCYSGLPLKKVMREHSEILSKIDALIPEPYVSTLPKGDIWRGSANQPLVALSELGRRRYEAPIQLPASSKQRFQVMVDEDSVWAIGIPDRGDLERLESAARARGIALGAVSWRA